MTVPAIRVLTLSILSLLLVPTYAFAQELTGGQIARNLEVEDSDASAGDILSITASDALLRSSAAYDVNIFGVVVDDPAIVLNAQTDATKSIISAGEAEVKVSTTNGNIEVGDFITSSAESGVGQKATDEGIVLGKALASYSGSGIGTIPVLLNIHHQSPIVSGGDLWEKISALTVKSLDEPDSFQLLLRYLFALILGSASFILGFTFAARAIRTGITAIGRNPLAKGTIQSSMFFNLFAVLALAVSGVGLSLFIIFYR